MKNIFIIPTVITTLLVSAITIKADSNICYFQETKNENLIQQLQNCFYAGSVTTGSKDYYGLLVHKWDSQGPFGEGGQQDHPEISISSSLINYGITKRFINKGNTCTICTYNEASNPMSNGGVIYDLQYLIGKKDKFTKNKDYASSPILCGFNGDGGTDNRPSRGGCGVSTNSTACSDDKWKKKQNAPGSLYWIDTPQYTCKPKCKAQLQTNTCIGNATALTTKGVVGPNTPYYVAGSQASFNYKIENESVNDGDLKTVLNKIIEGTNTANSYNEILVDQYYLQKNPDNEQPYDANAIVALFVTDESGLTETCKQQKNLKDNYKKDVKILLLNEKWTGNTDGLIFSDENYDCDNLKITCTNKGSIVPWVKDKNYSMDECVKYNNDNWACISPPYCKTTGPSETSAQGKYWKDVTKQN